MKKILISFFVIFIFLVAGLFGHHVRAERGTGSSCTPPPAPTSSDPVTDEDWFPYKFMCGGNANAIPGDVFLAGSPNGGTKASPQVINTGSSISFSGGYRQDGTPRGENKEIASEVFVWATIDANETVLSNGGVVSISNPSGSDIGQREQCPGNGSGRFETVYNYRDLEASGSAYGKNSSPAAWFPLFNIGKEDCGQEGKMVYWKNAVPSSNGYGFTINLNPSAEGQICVRLNVSVRFSSDQSYFEPDGSHSSAYWDSNDQHTVSSHVAQQSQEYCYLANNPPPVSRNVQCVSYTRIPLEAHSIYRFTTFSLDENNVATSPLNLSSRASFTGEWMTFSTASNYQTVGNGPNVFNTNSDFTDSNIAFRTSNMGMTLVFPNPTGPDRRVYIERWTHLSTGPWQYVGGSLSYAAVRDCYTASCQITEITAVDPIPGNPNAVEAGKDFTAKITIINTGKDMLFGSLTGNGTSARLGVTGTGYWPNPRPPNAIMTSDSYLNPGQSTSKILTFTAPSTPGTYSLSGYPDYYGVLALTGTRPSGSSYGGGSCSADIGPIKSVTHFTLTPKAIAPAGEIENPGPTIPINTAVDINGLNVPVYVNAYSVFLDKGNPTGIFFGQPDPVGSPRSINPPSETVLGTSYPTPATLTAGDKFCSRMWIAHGSGYYIGPNPGDVSWDSGPVEAPPACMTIVNKPYFKVQKGTISAGGDFQDINTQCDGGGILASWADNTSGPRGAGAELSSLALVKITGAASALSSAAATQVAPAGRPLGTALSFANTGAGVSTSTHAHSPNLGGNFGSKHCMNAPSQPSYAVNDIGGGPYDTAQVGTTLVNSAHKYKGDLKLDGGIVPGNSHLSIFVEGNVYITSNITLDTANPRAFTNNGRSTNVPSFTLVVTKGNIYIDQNVTQLDGIYVAKKDSNGGKIYTCGNSSSANAPPFTAMAKDDLYDNCHNQLNVYGIFMANQVNLMRATGSLRNSGSLVACSNPGVGGSSIPFDCPGEVFFLTPELYLADWEIALPNGGTDQVDSWTSLPPIL